MAQKVRPSRLRWFSYVFPDFAGNWTLRMFSRQVMKELSAGATDKFLELLLRGMDLAFSLSKSYRGNIENFNARYVFTTRKGRVGATADFADGNMRVHDSAKDQWNVRVTFTDSAALRRFLFGKDQDILNSLLANEVEVEGNLNYLYKFGFMAKDLGQRLGVA